MAEPIDFQCAEEAVLWDRAVLAALQARTPTNRTCSSRAINAIITADLYIQARRVRMGVLMDDCKDDSEKRLMFLDSMTDLVKDRAR